MSSERKLIHDPISTSATALKFRRNEKVILTQLTRRRTARRPWHSFSHDTRDFTRHTRFHSRLHRRDAKREEARRGFREDGKRNRDTTVARVEEWHRSRSRDDYYPPERSPAAQFDVPDMQNPRREQESMATREMRSNPSATRCRSFGAIWRKYSE